MLKLTEDEIREFNLFVKNFFTILSKQKSLSMNFILETLEVLLNTYNIEKREKFMKLFIIKSVVKIIKGEEDESDKVKKIKN